jgi:hypothetical protein
MIRELRVARRGAMKARIQAGDQLDAPIVTAPEPVRAPLRKLGSKQRIRACAALRPGPVSDPASAVKQLPASHGWGRPASHRTLEIRAPRQGDGSTGSSARGDAAAAGMTGRPD